MQWRNHNYMIHGMAAIPSAAFVFDKDLVCELEIKDFLDTEGILLHREW